MATIGTYLDLEGGRPKRQAAIATSTGASDAGKLIKLGSDGYIDISILPPGDREAKSIVCSEALAAGDFINYWNDTGTVKVRKADATTPGKEASAFVLAAYTIGQTVVTYNDGFNTGTTSLTLGVVYYLSTAAGGITSTPPSADGNVVQSLGIATSATELAVNIQPFGSTIVM